jgi:hypothetical protein
MANRLELLCDVLENQRRLTNWYLKKIPVEDMARRIEAEGKHLNSPLWNVAHLVWTDYGIGLLPLGYTDTPPAWIQHVGFGSDGSLPDDFPAFEEVKRVFDDTHERKLAFFKSLDDAILDADYAHAALGFKNNYYALLHLARHEGVHCGQLASFCKIRGIKTV